MNVVLVKKWVILTSALLVGQSAWAESAASPATAVPPPPPVAHHLKPRPEFDWIKHTQSMLGDLKTKLSLSDAQQSGWSDWSGTVISTTHSQLERIDYWSEQHRKRLGNSVDHAKMTTPERMAHGLEHLKVEVERLQDHVALLEKLQASTQTFYEQLDPKQKTIFDLYWQQMYYMGSIEHADMMMHGGMMQGHQSGHGDGMANKTGAQ